MMLIEYDSRDCEDRKRPGVGDVELKSPDVAYSVEELTPESNEVVDWKFCS